MRVGLIGCGRIAHWMHLPNLAVLEGVEVRAICDLNVERLRAAQQRWGISLATPNLEELINTSDIDAMLIATEDVMHASTALKALRSGKHVFIEKPMCLTLEEADEIVTLTKESGLVCMVGYHKLYDPAIMLARELLPDIGEHRMIHIHDICHDNALILGDILPNYMQDNTFLAGQTDFGDTPYWEAVAEGLFPNIPPLRQRAYRLLLNLACHDMSLLIGLFGEPLEVEFAEVWAEEPFAVVVLNYGDSTKCVMEVGQTRRKWFDERLTVYSADATLGIQWPSPFLKNSPTVVQVDRMRGSVEEHVQYIARYEEAFLRELISFFDCIKARRSPPTSAEHGRAVLNWMLQAINFDHFTRIDRHHNH